MPKLSVPSIYFITSCIASLAYSLKLSVDPSTIITGPVDNTVSGWPRVCPGYEYYGSLLSCGGRVFLLTRVEKDEFSSSVEGWTTHVRLMLDDWKVSNTSNLIDHAKSYNATRLSHNVAGLCWNGDAYLFGGQYRHVQEKEKLLYKGDGYLHYKGVYMSKTNTESLKTFVNMEEPTWLFDGRHPGCVETREGYDGACLFDGRMSAVQLGQRFYLFTRANTPQRHVQVTSAPTSDLKDWSPFSLIEIEGIKPSNHIYFLHAEAWNSSHLIGVFPGEITQWDPSNHTSGIFVTFSKDALHWTRPVLVYRQTASEHHVRIFPVGLLHKRLLLMRSCTEFDKAFTISSYIDDSDLGSLRYKSQWQLWNWIDDPDLP